MKYFTIRLTTGSWQTNVTKQTTLHHLFILYFEFTTCRYNQHSYICKKYASLCQLLKLKHCYEIKWTIKSEVKKLSGKWKCKNKNWNLWI